MAGLIGNVLEWFDFAVYGYLTHSIGKNFFPTTDPTAQLLTTYAVFAIGFFFRPIGSIVLGPVGDRIGRRALLTLSIALMGGSTLVIGVLPTYETIGVAAPILLIAMRMIQGFSLGGEFTGSMVYTTELASPRLRGLISSSTAAGTTLGFILGVITVQIIKATMAPEAVDAWGWRIPFIGSVAFCIVGWLLRRGIHEPDVLEKAAAVHSKVLASLWRDRGPIFQTFGIVAMTNAAYYLTFNFVVERRAAMNLPGLAPLVATAIALTMVLITKPLGGWLSDYVGRRRMMIGLTLVGMGVIYFALELMLYGSPNEFLIGQFMMGVPVGMALGLQGAMVVEIFPLRSRVTSMSVAYSVTLALSGGIAPLVATWMLDVLEIRALPAYYVMAYGLIGLLVMWPMKETNRRRLDDLDGTPDLDDRVSA
ncbi:MAG: MFS transporter [Myxococcales bacterium]|nr:MFS transporter [Myxococcales bacterium]